MRWDDPQSFMLPTALGDELTLATWLTASDRQLTMERRIRLICNRDQATVLRGRWNLVCIALSTGQARRMQPAFCQTYLSVLPRPAGKP